MTTAFFKSEITFNKMKGSISNRNIQQVTEQVYGKVTLKNDGKISISIENRNWNCGSVNDYATKIAKEIVASNFNHPAITQLKKDDNSLIKILADYTVDLKASYIEQCKIWAAKHFDLMVIASKTTPEENEISKDWRNNETRAKRQEIQNRIYKAYAITSQGKEGYILKSEKHAIEHYEVSLSKLAERISKKELDIEKLKVVSSGMGVNIEIILSDGNKSVKAWTIIASGEIQRPHYRYLVK